jgi:hypothetical protein
MINPARPMPGHRGAQLDEAHAAVRSLSDERRRLERLGLELPLALCHEQLRYWQFVAGVLSLHADGNAR